MDEATRKGNPSGFTLIEVVIAICILGFALLALAQLQITAVRGNAFADRMTTAATLAQDRLERLRGLPYDSIVNGQDRSGRYTRQWNVEDNTPAVGMKRVTVTVSCQDCQSVEIQTIVANE